MIALDLMTWMWGCPILGCPIDRSDVHVQTPRKQDVRGNEFGSLATTPAPACDEQSRTLLAVPL